MKKTIILILILTLIIPQGLSSVVLADDSRDLSNLDGREIIWDGDGETLQIQNNDTVRITNTAQGSLNIPKYAQIEIVGSVKYNATSLSFTIGYGAKVRWGAEYRGANCRIGLSGNGTFEIINGALIENTSGKDDTVAVSGRNIKTIMSGGTVRTKGVVGSSIYSFYSDVIINGGTLENYTQNGVTVVGRNVTINGGKVLSYKGTYASVSGSGNNYTNGEIDPANGNVIVRGGYVFSENSIAICGNGTVYVKGGTVSSRGEYTTIESERIKISGGTVTSAISDTLISNYTSISGGVVYSAKGHALTSDSGSGASALSNDSRQTMSSKGKARVSGGLILARGKKLSDVIDTKNVRVSVSKSKGIICTWNKNGKTRYTRGTKANLKVYTPNASVRWSKKGKLSGLSYKKGSKKGFARVKGIKVINPKHKKSQFKYSLRTRTYNGKRKSIIVTPRKRAGKVIAIYYQGVNGTKYKKSKIAPKKTGSYKVTINVSKSSKYRATRGLDLGTFKIRRAS